MDRDAPADFTPRFPGSGRLEGKVCLISGSSSGIGKAVALLFAREGGRIVVTYHSNKDEGDAVLAAVRAEGAEGIALHLDASDRASCRDAVARTVEAFGTVDVLVCNAGIQQVETDISEIEPDWVEKIFATNVYGYIWLAQAALEHMGKGGSIVCTTSVNAYRGHHMLLDYSATKGAELGFLRALAANLADKGIRVNGVAPGPIWTPLIGKTMPAEDVACFGTDVPMKRPGQPNEVAPAYLFLASDDGSYVTGQVLHPNGGIPVNG